MSSLQVRCASCGENVSVHHAKLADDCDYDMNVEDIRYYCPVCAIQAKNAAMMTGMLKNAARRAARAF